MLTDMKNFEPTEWQEYSDEHVMLIRAWDAGCPSVFETVRVKQAPDDRDTFRYRHEVIFIDEYLKDAARSSLNKVLNGFGYTDLDAFVMEYAPDNNFVYDKKGTLDRANSPSYIIDLWMLACFIAEYHGDTLDLADGEIEMPEADALTLVKEVTGKDYKCLGEAAYIAKGYDDENHSEVVIRPAICSDCTHCCFDDEGKFVQHICEAKQWDDIDPLCKAWDADCGRFCFDGGKDCTCFQVMQETGDEGPVPVGYVVVENCGMLTGGTIKLVLNTVQEKKLLGDVSYEGLSLRVWSHGANDFITVG